MTPEWLDDEDLPQPPRRELPGNPLLRRLGAAAVLLLAVAGIAVYARAAHPDRPSAHASPSHAATTSALLPAAPALPAAPSAFVVHANDRHGSLRNDVELTIPVVRAPAPCPPADGGSSACSTTHSVPASFEQAIRARLPGTRTVAVITQLLRARGPLDTVGLWSRRYSGRLGDGPLEIVIMRGVGTATSSPVFAENGNHTVVHIRSHVGGFTVEMEGSVPTARVPSLATLQALTRDTRLVAVR